MKMTRKTNELDSEKKDDMVDESAKVDLEAGLTSPFNSLEGYTQGSDVPIYRDDPRFRELLLHFQNAEWEQCLGKIHELLSLYPEDAHLLNFKQDVELRLRQQTSSKERQAKENLKRRRKLALRGFAIAALGLIVLLLILGIGRAYQVTQLNQEATLTAESLAAQYKLAESYMRAGNADEALRLYREIQQIDPLYQDVNQKIEQANQDIAIAELYQQGVQALQDGKSDEALQLFQKVEELHPKYKDTHQLIQKIKDEQQVASLMSELQNAYSQGDWAQVIHDYESIRAIAPSTDLSDLNEILFVSYREMILDIAGRSNLTLEDLETAEGYYRRALALFPQDREHASQRDELQKIAVELLANKYYLNAMSLLESSNYSIQGLQEAIRILTKASNIGPNSPAITSEIEKAQLFLDSYNSLLQQKWDDSISGFDRLSRKQEDYADGRLKYFLYEAYIARGDALFAFADFEGAFLDYQEAEKIAWSDEGNLVRLFQIETRIAANLRRLGRVKEAAEYYRYAFDQVGYQSRLTDPDEQELLNTITEAGAAHEQGDDLNSVRLYEIAMEQEGKLYDQKTIVVNQGDTLANIAFQNGTTIESLRVANQLGENMVVVKDQEFLVPVISTTGP